MRHFARRVSIGMSYKTIPDVDDGFGDQTPACGEYTLVREDAGFFQIVRVPCFRDISCVQRFSVCS